MPIQESWRTKITRWYFNRFPAYRGTGAKIASISHDWQLVRIELPLNRRTRNYVGTIFGGSIYAAADPIYMIMLIKILGSKYLVWDKSAKIQFIKPGRSTLYATFQISNEEVREIKRRLEAEKSIECDYTIEWKDAKGETCAIIRQTIYLRSK